MALTLQPAGLEPQVHERQHERVVLRVDGVESKRAARMKLAATLFQTIVDLSEGDE